MSGSVETTVSEVPSVCAGDLAVSLVGASRDVPDDTLEAELSGRWTGEPQLAQNRASSLSGCWQFGQFIYDSRSAPLNRSTKSFN